VEVGIDAWGRPTVVMEGLEPAVRRYGGKAVEETAGTIPPYHQGGEDGRLGTAGVEGLGGGVPPEAHRVEAIVDEWRIDDEWWRTPIHRRYVEVVLEGGAHVVLFEDLTTGEWFLQKP
jgi:hypothetical protein